MDKVILQKWLKAGYIEKDVFYKTDAGTPRPFLAKKGAGASSVQY